MRLLTEADYRRIEEAIARVETQSAAEFVVAVVPRSASYSKWRALVAALWAVACAMAYFRFVPWGHEYLALLMQVPVGLAVWAVLGLGPLHRLLIPKDEAERATRAAAFRMFAERGVHRTRDRSGMLLFISELEHRVVLLGDSGIHERVGTEGWEHHVKHVIQRIREGRAADGVLEVIGELEQILATKIPVEPGDLNELSNRVFREP